jgi:hypothetical protein
MRRLSCPSEFESPMVELSGQYSNFLRPDLVPGLRQLLSSRLRLG